MMTVKVDVLPMVLSEGELPRFIDDKIAVDTKFLNARLTLFAFSKKPEKIKFFFDSIVRKKQINIINPDMFFQAFNNACNMNKTAVKVFLNFAMLLPETMKSTEPLMSNMLKDGVELEKEQYRDCLNLALYHCPPQKIKGGLFQEAIWECMVLGFVKNLNSIFEVITNEKIFLTKSCVIELLNLSLVIQEKQILTILLEQLAKGIVWPSLVISDFLIILKDVKDVKQISEILRFIEKNVMPKAQFGEDLEVIKLVRDLILTASKSTSDEMLSVVFDWIIINHLSYAVSSEVIGKAMIYAVEKNQPTKLRKLLCLAREALLDNDISHSKLLAKCISKAVTKNRSVCLKMLFDAGLSIESASTVEKVMQLAIDNNASDVKLLMEKLYISESI